VASDSLIARHSPPRAPQGPVHAGLPEGCSCDGLTTGVNHTGAGEVTLFTKLRVAGLSHLTHATDAEAGDNLVRPDFCASLKLHGVSHNVLPRRTEFTRIAAEKG